MKRIVTSTAILLLLCFTSSAFAAPIVLRTGSIEPPGKSSLKLEAGKRRPAHYIVQFTGPIEDSWKQEVEKLGVKLGDYIPEYAFVTKMTADQAARVASLLSVRWIEHIRPQHRRDASLSGLSVSTVDVAIKLFPGESPSAVEAFVKSMGGAMLAQVQSSDRYLTASLPASALDGLASLESVEWIEQWVQPKPTNNVAQGIIGVHDVRQRIGLYGEGQIMAFADSGLDTGNLATLSDDFGGRILAAYALRRQDDWSDPTGHGTHAIGIALNSGVLSGSDPAQHSYDSSFAGVAPEADIVVQSIGDNSGFVYPPMALSTLFQPTYDLGARVHSDSWGSPVHGNYTFYCQQVDDFVNSHRDFITVFPMGNDGDDSDSNGVTDWGDAYAPATAKNCISVGATENVRSDGLDATYASTRMGAFPVPPIRNDHVSNNAQGMAAWSSRGPCTDGRIKPDICAPGTNILSTRNHAPGGTRNPWADYNADYVFLGGTSMSTPMVAGTAALVREYYIKKHGIAPSAALVKATMLNGAADIAPGQYVAPIEVPVRPNNVEGWGRVDLASTLDPPAPKVLEFVDEGTGLSTGQSRVFEYRVLGNSVPLAVTLVWTDPPASSLSGKQLVNDLHLRVLTPGGQTFLGNSHVDTTNNVESVDIATPAIGTYQITVLANNIPSGPQTYALVVSGQLPGSYIAGTVRTPSGYPISGVTMTIADGGIVYTTMTGQSGEYTIHLPADSYLVIPSKDGWTFDQVNRIVSVGEEGITGIDFTGSAAVGRITGMVTRAVGGWANYSLDTDHPYQDNADITYVINAHPSVTKIRVHLDEVDLQDGYDILYIEGADGTVYDQFSGEVSNEWSAWVTGNVAKIHLVSDDSTTYYGFHIDGYETDTIEQGPLAGVTVTAEPGGATAISTTDGTFAFEDMDPVSYTITPSLTHWRFSPDRKAVTVQPGGTASGQNFLAFPPGTISGIVSAGTTSEYAEVVESEHPYPEMALLTYPITGPPGCTLIRVHFTQIDMEDGWDFLDILDGADNPIQTFSGDYSDVWSSWVAGDTINIRLQSDESGTGYGFRIDKYAAVSGEHGISGVTLTTEPSDFTGVTNASGVFGITNVDAGLYFVSPTKPYWTFEPASKQVNVVAGVLTSGVGFYGTMQSMPGIAYIKSLPDGEDVCLSGMVVTAGTDDFPGCLYMEEATRFSGIKVATSQTAHAGDVVTVTGTIDLSGGERYIAASDVKVTSSTGVIPEALGLSGYTLGGRAFNAYTPGVKDGVGLNNIGLLVRTWGRVMNVGEGQFYLDDGSAGGIKVMCGSIAPPLEDTYAQVVGISTCEEIGSDIIRALRVRKSSDITPLTSIP